jgi:hypothetical protein
MALQSLDNSETLKIGAFVKYALYALCLYCCNSTSPSALQTFAAFTKERAQRSGINGMVKKGTDLHDILKWEKELSKAYKRFHVGVDQV